MASITELFNTPHMGLTIIMQDEEGNAEKTLPGEFDYDELEKFDLKEYHLLKYVDYYGDTIFNSLQFEDLKTDLKKLQRVSTQKAMIKAIIVLVDKADKQPHTYIRFAGD